MTTATKEVVAPPSAPYQINNIDPELKTYLKNIYQFNYLIWKRTGEYTSNIPNLSNMKVSVGEINTLAGIDTSQTIQNQLDRKEIKDNAGNKIFEWSNGIGFYGSNPVVQQIGGVATAGSTYTSNEQDMINKIYTALRNYGLLT